MKALSLFGLVASSIAVLAQAGIAADNAAGAATAGESRTKDGKPVLDKGMTAETILRLVGKPDEIVPVAVSDGKAEKWIYRRFMGTEHLLDATTEETIPVFLRANLAEGNVMGTATRPIFNLKHVTKFQMTALLMYEGELVVAKQWQEVSQSYDN